MFPHSVWAWLCGALCAYLLGSLSGAILISYVGHNEDIRNFGSGNAGMTNTLRTYGVPNALLVAGIDLLKTILAILAAKGLVGAPGGVMLGGAFAILGHALPVYYHFKGGKGVLCAAAILLMLDWKLLLAVFAVFLAVALATQTVSIASTCCCVAAPVCCLLLRLPAGYTAYTVCLALLILWLHRDNIRRILRGEEKKTVIAKRRKP